MVKPSHIKASIEAAVKARDDHLRRAFADSLAGGALPDCFAQPPGGGATEKVMRATVLFSVLRNFDPLAGRLGSPEVAELLTAYFERVCEPLLQNGGMHLRFSGHGVMSVFSESKGGSPVPSARRAISAALGMAGVAHEFRAWVDTRFGQGSLPPFAMGVGLHTGEVTICRVGTVEAAETMAIGDTVNVAACLERASKELGWTVVASSAVIADAGEGVQTGGMTSFAVNEKDKVFVDVAEVVGLAANPDHMHHEMATPAERSVDAIEAVGASNLRLEGYRLSRKIGCGRMTEVFLAEREVDGLPVVLKLLGVAGRDSGEHLSGLIQEYSLLSRIDHPNVIRILDQGFTDDHAYIAMEYFECGDLRAEIGSGMPQQRVAEIIAGIARALDAIHAMGIIHCDLKPENVMRRSDGSVVLADFGIAESMMQVENTASNPRAPHGTAVGTPYYLSPEQAGGKAVTPRSDLYSLGVMMFELLTGRRPFQAESLELLLAQHLAAPAPMLPAAHAAMQPVVDRLMEKQADRRYASAYELIGELERRGLLRTSPAAPRTARAGPEV